MTVDNSAEAPTCYIPLKSQHTHKHTGLCVLFFVCFCFSPDHTSKKWWCMKNGKPEQLCAANGPNKCPALCVCVYVGGHQSGWVLARHPFGFSIYIIVFFYQFPSIPPFSGTFSTLLHHIYLPPCPFCALLRRCRWGIYGRVFEPILTPSSCCFWADQLGVCLSEVILPHICVTVLWGVHHMLHALHDTSWEIHDIRHTGTHTHTHTPLAAAVGSSSVMIVISVLAS